MTFPQAPSGEGEIYHLRTTKGSVEDTRSSAGSGFTKFSKAIRSVLNCWRKREDQACDSLSEDTIKPGVRASILPSKVDDDGPPSTSSDPSAVVTLLEDLISIHEELSSPRLTSRSMKSIRSSLQMFSHIDADDVDPRATIQFISRASEYLCGSPRVPEEKNCSLFPLYDDDDDDNDNGGGGGDGDEEKEEKVWCDRHDNNMNYYNNDAEHFRCSSPRLCGPETIANTQCGVLVDFARAWTQLWNTYFPSFYEQGGEEKMMKEGVDDTCHQESSPSLRSSCGASVRAHSKNNSEIPELCLDQKVVQNEEDLIPFKVWIRERVEIEAEEMTDEIATRLHDKLPKSSIVPSSSSSHCNTHRSMVEDECVAFKREFDKEWDNMLSKIGETSGALMSARSSRKQRMSGPLWAVKQQWDKILKFIERWSYLMQHDEALHRYIWTLALREVALIDYEWRWPLVLSQKDLKNARSMLESSMLSLIESVDSWEEACKFYLHLILSGPMLRKLATRLSAKKLQNVESCEDTDEGIMWFCLSGRTWWQVKALVKTKAFADYMYYERLFHEDLTETEEKRIKLEKNIYRFLQLGRLEFAAGVLVLTGRHEDAERMLIQRESDFALSVFISRLRLES